MLTSKFLPTLISVSLLAACGCSMTITNGYRFDFKGEKDTGTLDVEIPPEATVLDLTNLHGDVTVTTSTDGTSSMHWELSCWADTAEEAKRQLKQIQFTSAMEGDTFDCEVLLPTEDKDLLRGVKSNFTISVPASIEVKVHNSHGRIEARQVDSRLSLHNRHGNIQATELTQPSDISNAHGNIELKDVVAATVENSHGDTMVTTAHESLKVESAHGSITVQDVMCNVDVETSFDNILLTNVTGLVVARNSHGDISGTQLHGDSLDVATSFAAIDLVSAASVVKCRNQHGDAKLSAIGTNAQEISVKTSFGDATVSLPGDCQPNARTSCTFGDVKNEFQDSTSQGPVVEVEAKHGDVRLLKLATAEQE